MHKFVQKSVLLAILLLASTSHAATLNDLRGYSSQKLVSGFSEYLEQHPQLVTDLAARPEAAEKVFNTEILQRQLMAGRALSVVVPTIRLNKNTPAPQQAAAKKEIARATALYEAAKNDENLRKQLASGALEEALARKDYTVEDITAVAQGETPPVNAAAAAPVDDTAPFATTDINAVPTAASLAPDANGWPQYLKAPSDCAAPTSGLQYIHEFVLNTRARNIADNNAIRNYFFAPGNSFDVYLTTRQVIAAPFIYSPSTRHPGADPLGMLRLNGAHSPMTAHGVSIAISDCPNDFGDEISTTRLGKNCISIQRGDQGLLQIADKDALATHQSAQSNRICQLETGKRYFFNMQIVTFIHDDSRYQQVDGGLDVRYGPHYQRAGGPVVIAGHQPARATPDAGWEPVRHPYCENKPCVAESLLPRGHMNMPTYAGTCLSKAPYPLNYHSHSCGRQFMQGVRCASEQSQTVECKDPQGEISPVRFTAGCQANGSPVWQEGYGQPLHSRLLCDSTALGWDIQLP